MIVLATTVVLVEEPVPPVTLSSIFCVNVMVVSADAEDANATDESAASPVGADISDGRLLLDGLSIRVVVCRFSMVIFLRRVNRD